MASDAPPVLQGHVALVGLGEIGVSFAALYLRHTSGNVHVFDTRLDLEAHILAVLPGYLSISDNSGPPTSVEKLLASGRLRLCASLEEACTGAAIVQEQGPENLAFKRAIWPQIEAYAPPSAHLWSSTSGIAASLQNQDMSPGGKERLLVAHPFNPPHILPLIEVVPSPRTKPEAVEFVRTFLKTLGSGHRPIIVRKEVPGFVGNRLAFAVLREACSLVDQGVVSAHDIDEVMMASVGPRWAVQGLFDSYNMGGGAAGIKKFFAKLDVTVQDVWDSTEPVNFASRRPHQQQPTASAGEIWEAKVVRETTEAYGLPTPDQYAERDAKLRQVLAAQGRR